MPRLNLRLLLISLIACTAMIACKNSDQAHKKVYSVKKKDQKRVPPKMMGGKQALIKELKYPEQARDNHSEGTVILNFLVTKKGTVKDIKVKQSVTPLLDRTAKNILKKMRFKPALQDGKPIDFRINWPVFFGLN